MSSNTQGNFDNDPNNFGAQAQGGGRRGGASWDNDATSGTTFSDSDLGAQPGQQRVGSQGQQGLGSTGQQGYGADNTQGDNWDSNQGGDTRRRAQPGNTSDTSSGGYAGDTTDFNTPGTGGNLTGGQGQHKGSEFDSGAARTGARAGPGTGAGTGARDNWDDDDNLGRQQGQGHGGKPSVGDRLKGGVEKVVGKVSGNQAMADRGHERTTGSNEDYGTNF